MTLFLLLTANSQAVDYKFCAKNQVTFYDTNLGNKILDGTVPPRYRKVQQRPINGPGPILHQTLDDEGCTTFVRIAKGKFRYVVEPIVEYPNNPPVAHSTNLVAGNEQGNLPNVVSPVYGLNKTNVTYTLPDSDANAILLTATEAVGSLGTNDSLEYYFQYELAGGGPAYTTSGGSTIFLPGPDTSDRRSILHEMGHAVLLQTQMQSYDAWTYAVKPALTGAPCADSHYNPFSREWGFLGFHEGFAEFWVAAARNTRSNTICEMGWGTLVLSCEGNHDGHLGDEGLWAGDYLGRNHLENYCPPLSGAGAQTHGNQSTPIDWLRYFWDVYKLETANVDNACGGTVGDAMTVMEIVDSLESFAADVDAHEEPRVFGD